jgi:hypothetical protein
VDDQNVSIRVVDDLRGDRPKHPIQPVVAVATHYNQIDIEFPRHFQNAPPGFTFDDEWRPEADLGRRAGHQLGQLASSVFRHLANDAIQQRVCSGGDIKRHSQDAQDKKLGVEIAGHRGCGGEDQLASLRLVDRGQE